MEIRISAAKQLSDEKGKPYTAYSLIVIYNGWENTVDHRYSEFLELHRVMKLMRRVFNSPLPHFPGQKLLKAIFHNLSQEDIENRRRKLEDYMNELIMTDCAHHSQYFTEFLGMPQSVKEQWMSE
ncbi:unnamed protein product [Blepharisma stoltei]|uniref:PX domain-containing protein n=1 Tax=Blepharisma stoltei TaxID=1481888 RepID=A0AAU9IHS8_9CILI|nr:unnamed protein product [Blepharisma stoltei]